MEERTKRRGGMSGINKKLSPMQSKEGGPRKRRTKGIKEGAGRKGGGGRRLEERIKGKGGRSVRRPSWVWARKMEERTQEKGGAGRGWRGWVGGGYARCR